MTNFGGKTKSKRISELVRNQSSSDQTDQDSNHGLERITSFKQCKEVLSILLAQIGNARIRNMYKERLMDYLNRQEATIKQLGIKNHLLLNGTSQKYDDHIQAMADLYDNHDIVSPPHQHTERSEDAK